MKLNSTTLLQQFTFSTKLTKTVTMFALVTGLVTGTASAGNHPSYTDYARVVDVQPIYRYVTTRKPVKTCTPGNNVRKNYSHRYSHNRPQRNSPPRYTGQPRHRTNNAGSILIGGLIGGAIGHEVSKSVNGRANPGATVAGAIIGSTIANAASTTSKHNGYRSDTRLQVSPTQRHNTPSHNTRQLQQHQQVHRNRHGNNGLSHHHRNPARRCTTTTQTHREQRLTGYDVTYMYHGRRYTTRTSQRPGHRIAVQVNVSAR